MRKMATIYVAGKNNYEILECLLDYKKLNMAKAVNTYGVSLLGEQNLFTFIIFYVLYVS